MKPAQSAVLARKPVAWALVALWACFIFFMSSRSGSNLEADMGLFSEVYRAVMGVQAALFGPEADVANPIAHFFEYAVFGALLHNAFASGRQSGLKWAILAVVCASLYGVTDELHQYFVPARACDPADWLVDTLGALLGSFVYLAWSSFARDGRAFRRHD